MTSHPDVSGTPPLTVREGEQNKGDLTENNSLSFICAATRLTS